MRPDPAPAIVSSPAARHSDTSANDTQPMLLGAHPHAGAAVVIVLQRSIYSVCIDSQRWDRKY
jgi:hypothetical protein